jgi:hypothetical protein
METIGTYVDERFNSTNTKIRVLADSLSKITPTAFVAQSETPSNTNVLWIDTTPTTGGLKYYDGTSWVTVPVRFS